MTPKELKIRYHVLNYFVGCVYVALNETVPNKVRDLDEILQEIIDDKLDDGTSGEIGEQHMRLLRAGIHDALGCHSMHLSQTAKEELEARAKVRDENYSEVDL